MDTVTLMKLRKLIIQLKGETVKIAYSAPDVSYTVRHDAAAITSLAYDGVIQLIDNLIMNEEKKNA